MEEKDSRRLEMLFEEFLDAELLQILFSNSTDKEKMLKAKARPFLLNGRLVFQIEKLIGKQAFHQNFSKDEAVACLVKLLGSQFRQCEIQSEKGWAQVLVSKKGTVTVKRKMAAGRAGSLPESGRKRTAVEESPAGAPGVPENMPPACRQASLANQKELKLDEAGSKTERSSLKAGFSKIRIDSSSAPNLRRLSHNRTKSYVLEEGTPVPFLVDLGVMTKEGRIVRSKYDKFRQINRFLEFIEDILPQLSKDRENTIIDFGCGKSYLTFAMYHYLKVMKGYDIRVIGLDLKHDVIDHCNALSRKYEFDTLQFYHGDIASYEGVNHVDMVVTLHACDIATDFALAKAVNWGAQVILSVPCCQHEWNRQMKNELMKPVLQYGLLKERMAAIYTDGLRAEILEHMGYRTQILEFIDMEHTPKNILIRAVYQGKPKDNCREIREILDFWDVKPMLAELLL